MKEINQQFLNGERALFQEHDSRISYCTFADGESPLKESRDLEIDNCLFRWKYPLWYSKNITMKNSALFDMARAGIWYGENISVQDTVIEAPKNFRRTRGIVLQNVNFPNASETLWNCQDIEMDSVTARGDYFARQVILRSLAITALTEAVILRSGIPGCSPRMLSGMLKM